MAELSLDQRRQLLAKHIDRASLNWAHVCIASLMQQDLVDRILTTNFDPLIIQACALLGEFPAVFDFATSQILEPANIPDKAVFYLHGQRTGFVLLSDQNQVANHSEKLGPLFQATGEGRVWIVVGYSGENDPVFDHLAKVSRFRNNLYWVCFKNNPPSSEVRGRLLTDGKDAYFTNGYDADEFFLKLATALKIFPPDLVGRPFTYLLRNLSRLPADEHITGPARQSVQTAVAQFEKPMSVVLTCGAIFPTPHASEHVIQELQKVVVVFQEEHDERKSKDSAQHLSWASLVLGNLRTSQAQTDYSQSDVRFEEAGQMYQKALSIRADYYECLNNWGASLVKWALTKKGVESQKLLSQATERFSHACILNPQGYEAINNFGVALYYQALNSCDGEEADRLFDEGMSKYESALQIKPDMFQVHHNCCVLLSECAKRKGGDEGDRLFRKSQREYTDALRNNNDPLHTHVTWGGAFLQWESATDKSYERVLVVAEKAERIKWGGGAYISASMNALIEDEEACKAELRKAKLTGSLPDRHYVLNDPNLISVRELGWFQEIIEGQSH
ncbi:MAG TPA: SIR2 family protein [Pyrinomonadaceae bacterium]|nr:SIR2 family protein [Pyrinomonadaceae bacterium]